MRPIVIAAPFGNWLSWPYCTSTLGTYTRAYRGGVCKRLWRMLRTVRYYPGIKAWKNQLGLPNPGIDSLVHRIGLGTVDVSDKIISVSARQSDDWRYVISLCFNAAYLELNVSCPNCPGETDESDYQQVFRFAVSLFPGRVLVKLPPVNYRPIVCLARDCGVTGFHCCNTLPTPGGGLSGKPLKPLSLQAVRDVKNMTQAGGYPLDYLIGGGGITTLADVVEYLEAGATNVAVASVLFWPWKWPWVKRTAQELANHHITVPVNK